MGVVKKFNVLACLPNVLYVLKTAWKSAGASQLVFIVFTHKKTSYYNIYSPPVKYVWKNMLNNGNFAFSGQLTLKSFLPHHCQSTMSNHYLIDYIAVLTFMFSLPGPTLT